MCCSQLSLFMVLLMLTNTRSVFNEKDCLRVFSLKRIVNKMSVFIERDCKCFLEMNYLCEERWRCKAHCDTLHS